MKVLTWPSIPPGKDSFSSRSRFSESGANARPCPGDDRGSTAMLYSVIFQPIRKVAGDIRRAIATEQPGFMDDLGLVAA